MGIAQDLLQPANHLATYEGNSPTQASLRRAVSTSYYALFHLLLEDASQHWLGSPEARHGLERAFDHGQMKKLPCSFEGRLGGIGLVPTDKYPRKSGALRARS